MPCGKYMKKKGSMHSMYDKKKKKMYKSSSGMSVVGKKTDKYAKKVLKY